MKRRILFIAALFAASLVQSEPIDDSTFWAVMEIADIEHVPRSVGAQLLREESGGPVSRGDASAIGDESTGWPSKGLCQLHTQPENIDYLVKTYWTERGEKEPFDILNPRHNATIAFRYLYDLHERFGSWYFATAYYNCGPPRWDPIARRYIPKKIPPKTHRYAIRIISAKEP